MLRSGHDQGPLSRPSGGGSRSWICRTCGLHCEGDAQGAACPYCGDLTIESIAPPLSEQTLPSGDDRTHPARTE
jgi:hypothetical protein